MTKTLTKAEISTLRENVNASIANHPFLHGNRHKAILALLNLAEALHLWELTTESDKGKYDSLDNPLTQLPTWDHDEWRMNYGISNRETLSVAIWLVNKYNPVKGGKVAGMNDHQYDAWKLFRRYAFLVGKLSLASQELGSVEQIGDTEYTIKPPDTFCYGIHLAECSERPCLLNADESDDLVRAVNRAVQTELANGADYDVCPIDAQKLKPIREMTEHLWRRCWQIDDQLQLQNASFGDLKQIWVTLQSIQLYHRSFVYHLWKEDIAKGTSRKPLLILTMSYDEWCQQLHVLTGMDVSLVSDLLKFYVYDSARIQRPDDISCSPLVASDGQVFFSNTLMMEIAPEFELITEVLHNRANKT